MLETLLSFEWLNGFLWCGVSHWLLSYFNLKSKTINSITCIGFQTYFVYTAAVLMYAELNSTMHPTLLKMATLKNMHNIYGYFVYDTWIILTEPTLSYTFLAHHIASLNILNMVESMGVTETLCHNAVCFLGEVTNPFLNIRYLVTDYPLLKQINKQVILLTYALFRITLFPLFSLYFLYINYNVMSSILLYSLFGLFIAIYGVSLTWFRTILLMNRVDNLFGIKV